MKEKIKDIAWKALDLAQEMGISYGVYTGKITLDMIEDKFTK